MKRVLSKIVGSGVKLIVVPVSLVLPITGKRPSTSSITGLPYDTLHEVIGIKDNPSSLKSYGIKYEQIDLVNDDFDYKKITDFLKKNKVKVIEIQRSKGYSTRKSISINKIERYESACSRNG